VSLQPSSATFAAARAATIQAAGDLYGSGSALERGIADAWTSVGVRD
jgi:Zn-dependent metalloprotease